MCVLSGVDVTGPQKRRRPERVQPVEAKCLSGRVKPPGLQDWKGPCPLEGTVSGHPEDRWESEGRARGHSYYEGGPDLAKTLSSASRWRRREKELYPVTLREIKVTD